MPSFDARTFAEAYRIASRVISLALGCIVPAIIGHFLDRWFTTAPVGVVIGSLIGMASVVPQLRRLIRETAAGRPKT
jgi:F0F1-type ATP synthase assembly protein I